MIGNGLLWHCSCLFRTRVDQEVLNKMVNEARLSCIELFGNTAELQFVHNYFNLLKESYERYDYLRKSGASEGILFVEKGLIDNQLQFLFKSYKKIPS